MPLDRNGYNDFLSNCQHDQAIKFKFDEPLSNHCNWKIGGPADLFVEPRTVDQIVRILRAVEMSEITLCIIGDGTNLLFDDSGVRGLVMKIGADMSKVEFQDGTITAEAGIWVPKLARMTQVLGLSGMEHAIGIPGTLGGLVTMNGGSLRHGIGEVITYVDALNLSGEIRRFETDECAFSYRSSIFQDSNLIIVGCQMECSAKDPKLIRREMFEILRSRRHKFPLKMPSCGSVFTSGTEMYEKFGPAGKVIEDAGLKGFRIGDAQVSWTHANFFVNTGSAKSTDMMAMIKTVRDQVHSRTGIWMECEARYVAPNGTIKPIHMFL